MIFSRFKKTTRLVLRVILAAIIVGALAWLLTLFTTPDVHRIDDWISNFGSYAPAAYIVAYIIGAILFFPGSLLGLAGGALFGPIWGALLNLCGATLGATVSFTLSRYFFRDWIQRRRSRVLVKFLDGVNSEGWRFVALVRLVPIVPFNLANYALGVTRIRLIEYVLTSFICMAPGAVAYSWVGYAGRQAMLGDEATIQYGMIAIGIFAAIIFGPRLIKRLCFPHMM